MTGSLAPDDPETLAFETTVERGGREVVLSETYFYPGGGSSTVAQAGGLDADGETVVAFLRDAGDGGEGDGDGGA